MYNQKMIALGETRSIIRELFEYGNRLAEKVGREKVFDFTIGNPSAPTPKAVNETIADKLKTDPHVHDYTSAEGLKSVRKKVAEFNKKTYGLPVSWERVYMTCGANAALAISLFSAVTPQQNEVVLFVPFYPEYRVFAENAGAKVLTVPMDEETFQIDFDALKKVLSPKTAAVIVNSPNNPSGIVYTRKTLEKLSQTLVEAEKEFGTTIVLISDEPYREIVYDGSFFSPVACYPDAVLCYSYSKAFSLPGERIGYVAVSDKLNLANKFFAAVMGAGRALGYVCAPSIFQRVVECCIDQPSQIDTYRNNRDLLVPHLQKIGFEVVNPQGAFYVLVKAPNGNANHFAEAAMKQGILFVPTESFGLDGYVRVATCVSPEMLHRSLPVWENFAKLYLGNLK